MRDRAQINDVHVQGASEVFTPGVSQPHIVHVPPGCLSLISPTYPALDIALYACLLSHKHRNYTCNHEADIRRQTHAHGAYIHTHTHTCTNTCKHKHIHAQTHTCAHTCQVALPLLAAWCAADDKDSFWDQHSRHALSHPKSPSG